MTLPTVSGTGWTRVDCAAASSGVVTLIDGTTGTAVLASDDTFTDWDGLRLTVPVSLTGAATSSWVSIGLLDDSDTTTLSTPLSGAMEGVSGFWGVELYVDPDYQQILAFDGGAIVFGDDTALRSASASVFDTYEVWFSSNGSDMDIELVRNGASLWTWTVTQPTFTGFRVAVAAYGSGTSTLLAKVSDDVSADLFVPISLSGSGAGSGAVTTSTASFDHEFSLVGSGAGAATTDGFAADVLRLSANGSGSAGLTIPRNYPLDASTGRPAYRIELLDAATGDAVGEVEAASYDTLQTALNAAGTFGFTVAANDPKAALIRPNLTEVRLWRGAQLEWWGVIVRATSDGVTLRVQATGLHWYLSRRTIGKIPKDNLLTNGDFENGEIGWTFGWVPGSTPAVPPVHSISSDALTKAQALQIEGASTTQTIVTGLLATTLFYPNSATLLPGGEEAIAAVAATIVAGPIEVVGHTANDGTGTGLRLSQNRATVVANIIAANTDIRPITSKGVGYYDPDPAYAIDAPEQRRVTISATGTVEAKGNKQYVGQRLTYTNPSTFRKMPLTLVAWYKVLDWVDAGIGYGASLELVDPEGVPPLMGQMFDKNKSSLRTGMDEAIKQLGYAANGAIEVVGHAASDETNPSTLSAARATTVAAILSAASAYPVTHRGAGTGELVTIDGKTTADIQRTVTYEGTIDAVVASATVQMDSSTPKNAWTRQEASIDVPADGRTYFVDCRLFPPQGTVLWDSATLTEGIVLGFYDQDQASIVAGLVAHAQDVSLGKSDLGIGTVCPPTGVIRTREYPWSDRKPVTEALAEFPTLQDGIDWDMCYTPSSRWVQTWHPRRGRSTAYALAYGSNVTSWSTDHDGEQTGSTVVVQATNGFGSGREEGVYIDAAPLEGIVLERVYQAPTDSSIGTLDAQAAQGWGRYSKPVRIPRVVCHPGFTTELLNTLGLGDVVRLVLPDVDGLYRITGIALDPTTDQLTIQLAEE